MSKKQGTQCCVWDITIHEIVEVDELRTVFKQWCKKYCFQLEKGEKTGKLHYQCRISLKSKKRKGEVIKIFAKYKAHVSPTSNENRDNMFYVMKDDTRIQGPYSDENEVYIPRDIKEITKLYEWQKSLRDELLKYDTRKIDFIIDTKGNNGKSTFTRYMMCYHQAELLPFCNDYRDIMRMAFDVTNKKIFLLDLPRAINKEKLFQFIGAIETLKTGYIFDDRYHFKKELIDPPRIAVFTNSCPDKDLLSNDRWNMWEITKDKRLKNMNETDNGNLDISIESDGTEDSRSWDS